MGALASSVAHEFNNILTTIIGLSLLFAGADAVTYAIADGARQAGLEF